MQPLHLKRNSKRFVVGVTAVFFILLATTLYQAQAQSVEEGHVHDEQGTVTYELTWTNTALDVVTDGTMWTAVNDLGYTIHLTDGYIADASIELIPCEAESDTTASSGFDWLLPQVAYAGHGTGDADDSRMVMAQIESLTELENVLVGTAVTSDAMYCQGHYLLSPLIDDDSTSPDQTLSLSGYYTEPNSDILTPFTIQTDLAWGRIIDLAMADGATVLHMDGCAVQITIQRDVSGLFDGVDFATLTADEQARTILRTLVDQTTLLGQHLTEMEMPME